jgi:hypothetical protein
MNKRLLISLTPLIVTGAFALMPAASQAACTPPACPHVYVNKGLVEAGVKVQYIEWGNFKLKNGTLGEVDCQSVFAGYSENPVSPAGGQAIGKVQAFYPYNCRDIGCKVVNGEVVVIPEKLPWKGELIEPVAKEFRQKTGEKGEGPQSIYFKVECTGISLPQFFGENNPLILNNGSTIGSKPGELHIDKTAGELESKQVGNGFLEGNVKVMGYEEEEQIEAKNP